MWLLLCADVKHYMPEIRKSTPDCRWTLANPVAKAFHSIPPRIHGLPNGLPPSISGPPTPPPFILPPIDFSVHFELPLVIPWFGNALGKKNTKLPSTYIPFELILLSNFDSFFQCTFEVIITKLLDGWSMLTFRSWLTAFMWGLFHNNFHNFPSPKAKLPCRLGAINQPRTIDTARWP